MSSHVNTSSNESNRLESDRRDGEARQSGAGSLSRREAVKTLGGAAGLAAGLLSPAADAAKAAPASEDAAPAPVDTHYVFNREPLPADPRAKLPLGAVEPKGWLKKQLERMAGGMAGRLGELYANVSPVSFNGVSGASYPGATLRG
jgi:hypothetical protein